MPIKLWLLGDDKQTHIQCTVLLLLHVHTLTYMHMFTQVNDSLVYIDGIVESIFAGLERRGVKECVNTIIISDHGMARLGTRKFVRLSEVRSAEFQLCNVTDRA